MRAIISLAVLLCAIPALAAEVPSCARVAASRTVPGVSPACQPARTGEGRAARMFGELGILRLAHAFYVLRPAPAWGPVEAATLWRDLARAVAAVHASQRSRADVYFLAVPESEPEKRMLLARLQLHRPPVPYLVAHARALPDGPGRLYVLTVYGHADDPGAD